MSHHCPACQVVRELTEHRDQVAANWTSKRAVLTFAVIVAERACPEYVPATTEEPA